MLGLSALPRPVKAESPPEIGFSLYSWKHGNSWYFSVLEGTMTVHPLADIQAPKNRLRGPNYLKGRLAALPSGEKIFWRQEERRGLPLPPKELIHDITQFAESTQIQLFLPGDKP
jgi:hypothetical protein